MKRNLLVLTLVLTIFAMVLGACAPAATPAPTQPPAATQPPAEATQPPAATQPPVEAARTYVLVPKNLGNPYFDTANKGAQEAAKELGVTVLYQGSAVADAFDRSKSERFGNFRE
ncbi:MAG: hypothetical protein N3A60_03880 [Thermanaerothrix sp.]|nr:hypothetical protein [Thermanaerothrix sp.]